MSLKDRLKNKVKTKKPQSKPTGELCEFKISIKKVSKAINSVSNVSDLGNIVQEFSRFLSTLPTENANITFSGNFDLGQKTLLNCVLGNFLDNGTVETIEQTSKSNEDEAPKEPSKLIKKRRSLKSKLAKENEDEA